MKIAVLCGGPSLERGISLNSARSVLDHLAGEGIDIIPIYFDAKKRAFKISTAQLYSNTPSDFDFKLAQTARSLSRHSLLKLLTDVQLVFPAIHGPFGEDGEIQRWLERHNIPFVGAGSEGCKRAFDKYKANEFIRSQGFFTLPSAVLKIYHSDHKKIIDRFFNTHKVRRAVVKPASGGSSIGVFSVRSPKEALDKTRLIFSKRMDTRVVLEPFAAGVEFTVIVLQNRFDIPVAILPTEIEAYYTKNQFFDFRKKYLPTNRVTYHCPPRFGNKIVEQIQVQAEQLFTLLGMRDFARFDGWVLPNGKIWFCDFNPLSGMEQNSFLFQQTSRIGFSHSDILRYVVKSAARRSGIRFPVSRDRQAPRPRRKPVSVLFGGSTSERQVSVMSGTNVWLKLRNSKKYEPQPFLLDTHGAIWRLPYALTLNHTVEEIQNNCEQFKNAEPRPRYLEQKVTQRLALVEGDATEQLYAPKKMSLKKFIASSKYVFIGLHGGMGENGRLQNKLSKQKVLYNGSGEQVSRICIDKARTAQHIRRLDIKGLDTPPHKLVTSAFLQKKTNNDLRLFWKDMVRELQAKTVIVKPRADGCSSGIVRLYSARDLHTYIALVRRHAAYIPAGTFRHQRDMVEMPIEAGFDLLFEKFIETDVIRLKGNRLKYARATGWVEVTVGLREKRGAYSVLSPSITVAEGNVLSVEEKFQGGTGINITPPPKPIVAPGALVRAKKLIAQAARAFGLKGYARVDTFMHVETGNLIIIEINTLPALTPSTVLYHQGLAEKPPIFPRDFLEGIISSSGY